MPIVISGLSKAFGEKQVLENFSCTLPAPGLTALMGPSGVGKTTLFRILLGLEKPDSGVIFGMEGKTLSVVFQEDRLFPGSDGFTECRGGRNERGSVACPPGASK